MEPCITTPCYYGHFFFSRNAPTSTFSIRKPFQCSHHINRATNHISQPVQFYPIYIHDHSPVADFVCTDAQLFTSVNHCDVSVNTSLNFDHPWNFPHPPPSIFALAPFFALFVVAPFSACPSQPYIFRSARTGMLPMQANPTPSSTVNPLKGPNFHSPLVTIVIGF